MFTIDNKHAIRDPFGPRQCDMDIFAKTLKQTRIPDLFRTAVGLPGHAQQLEQEFNRLARVEGRLGEEVDRAVRVLKELRGAVLKSKQAALECGFCCLWHGFYSFSLA